jgi:hypothetical protein
MSRHLLLTVFVAALPLACDGSKDGGGVEPGTSAGRAGAGAGAAGHASGGASASGSAGTGGASGMTGDVSGAPQAGEAGAAGDATSVVTYATSFSFAQSPLSETGAWHHEGFDWTLVKTGGGNAYGTQELGVTRSGPTGYNDSYAYLAGFPADQTASGVVALYTIDTSCTHEVEILLRWADSAHDARGYECNVAFDGSYAQIVRWNGPVGDYTYLGEGNVPGGMHDGDTVSASVVGSHITLSVNGTVRATADDTTFVTGNPGIGFWRGSSGCGSFGDYGFTSFSASSLPE